jgi:hypothetical protein
LRRIGNSNPSASERAQAILALNMIVKRVDVRGRWLWAISNTASTLTLANGTRAYSAGATASTINTNILELESVFLVEGTSTTELEIIDKSRAISNPYRDDSGKPLEVYLETAPVMANQKMHFFPTPNSTYSIQYYFRRRLYDFMASSDDPDFPGEWVNYLVKELAGEISPEYGVPLQERQYLKMEAEAALRDLNATNAEAAPTQTVQTLYF